MDIDVIASPHAALDRLRDQLVATGSDGEVVIGILNRLVDEPEAWGDDVTMFVGSDDGVPLVFTVRTGSFPALVVGFCEPERIDYDALALAHAYDRLGRTPGGVNGATPHAAAFAAAWTRRGMEPTVKRSMRTFELRSVRFPTGTNGELRLAKPEHVDLLVDWVDAFGRDIGEPQGSDVNRRTVDRLVATDDFVVWSIDGTPVSMAGINRRTDCSSTIASVYTPPEHRRHGYASALVAALSQRELDAGAEWCSLFTDLANPTSNHIYQEIGYEPCSDFRNYEWETVADDH